MHSLIQVEIFTISRNHIGRNYSMVLLYYILTEELMVKLRTCTEILSGSAICL